MLKLFRKTFNTNGTPADMFQLNAGQSNEFQVSVRKLHVDDTLAGSGSEYSCVHNKSGYPVSDYWVSAKVNYNGDTSSSWIGVKVRALISDDGQSGYCAVLDAENQKIKLYKQFGLGNFTNVGTYGYPGVDFTIDRNTTYEIKLHIEKNTIKVYVDDVLYITATDYDITVAGVSGVFAFLYNGDNSITWDDLQCYSVNDPVVKEALQYRGYKRSFNNIKEPNEEYWVSVDFDNAMSENEELDPDNYTITAYDDLGAEYAALIDQDTVIISDKIIYFRVQNGVDDTKYDIKINVQTNQGNEFEFNPKVTVKEVGY